MQPREQRRLQVSCSFLNVRKLAAFARACCEENLSAEDAALVELAIAEAANNIVGHSYRDSEGWPIEIVCRLEGSRLEFLLADSGLPFNPENVPPPSFDWEGLEEVPEHGRGVFLIKSIMNETRFLRRGDANLCFLAKELPPENVPVEEPESERQEETAGFLCDCANPFLLLSQEGEKPQASAKVQEEAFDLAATPLLQAGSTLAKALSLQACSPAAALDMLAQALRCGFSAEGAALWRKREACLEKTGSDGEVDEKPKRLALDGADIESQIAALNRPGVADKRLCIPLAGIGRLLGVATLSFKTQAEADKAKSFANGLLASLASVALENQAVHSKALEAECARKEMETAVNLHKGIASMLVPNFPEMLIYAKSQPAQRVGGDYLSFRKDSDDKLWFMICDAMGKGMAASFFSILAHMTFQSVLFIHEDLHPGSLLTMCNRIMAEDFDRFEMFMTALVGKIDLKEKVLHYASAGHCPPIIYKPGAEPSLLDTQDYMLGVDSDIEYKTFSVPFDTGARLVAYTDGLTDIVGPDGEMLGVDPLLEAFAKHFKQENVIRACEKVFTGAVESAGEAQQDDITLIGLQRL